MMSAYEDIVNLALRRSLFYPASEIYANAPAGMYDFGPTGTAIRRKIVELWRKQLVSREDMLEIDGALIMPESVFKASGHLTNFNDPVTQCKKCNVIHRADKLLEDYTASKVRNQVLLDLPKLNDMLSKLNVGTPQVPQELSQFTSHIDYHILWLVQLASNEVVNKTLASEVETRQSEIRNKIKQLPTDLRKSQNDLNYAIRSIQNQIDEQKKQAVLIKVQFREAMPVEELTAALNNAQKNLHISCPNCKGELMDVKQFNMMVRADVGVSAKASCYLRPETCQTIFTNWQRMMKTMRVKLPKGIAQVGKVFRNEISPRQTLIREVEFSQMEAEVFFDPTSIDTIDGWDNVKDYPMKIMKAGSNKVEDVTCEQLVAQKLVSGKLIAYYLARTQQLFEKLGIPLANMRFRELDGTERAFYAKEAFDFEVMTSLGWVELAANNYRTDYDLGGHQKESQKDLQYVTPEGRKFIPHVWEISIGLDRTFYTVLELAYRADKEKERVWLSLPFALAPQTAGIFPLLANKSELVAKAEQVYNELRDCYDIQYDESGSIGKRYARMDEIGVPWCITIDFDSLNNNDATIRARDTGAQKRVPIADLRDTLYQLITGKMTL